MQCAAACDPAAPWRVVRRCTVLGEPACRQDRVSSVGEFLRRSRSRGTALVPGYLTKQERIAVPGVADLMIRSLLDRQQFSDPFGIADRRGISSASWPLFGLLWPSGVHLAARLAARPLRAGERILEVGCGLALASLVGHRRGADVTASDFHPLAASFLRKNLRLNNLAPMPYRDGDWAAAEPLRPEPTPGGRIVSGRFDLIIGSDLLYERDDRSTLAAFIGRHAQPTAEVWIVDPDRGNRPAFNRQMASLGFAKREEPLAVPAVAGAAVYKGRTLIYARSADAGQKHSGFGA